MLEKFTKEEVKAIIEELKAEGYTIKSNNKGYVLREAAEELGLENPFIASNISHAITEIADYFTDNYEKRGETGREYKRKMVENDIMPEYKEICKGIINAISKYYGRPGFRNRGH